VKRFVNSPYLAYSVVDSAIGLLLVEVDGHPNAMTISLFSEAAHHPTTLWISVSKNAFSHELITKSGRFSLAILNSDQKSIAISCGTVSGRKHNKCDLLDLYRGPDNFLFLRGALSSTACKVRESIDLDDHTLFIADIIETHLNSRTAHLRHLLLSDLRES